MSYHLHAAGTGGFTWSRNYSDEGDVYDMASAMSLAAATPGGIGAVAEEYATGELTPTGPVEQTLSAVGRFSMMGPLCAAFTMMLVDRHAVQLFVSAQAPSSMPFFPDVGGHMRYIYDTRDRDPFWDFMRDLTPRLEAADLNRFGVLRGLTDVFNRWPMRRSHGMQMLNINLTAT